MSGSRLQRAGRGLAPLLAVAMSAGTAWSQTPLCMDQVEVLYANDGVPYDYFGTATTLHGDTLFVGSPYDDDYGVDSGSVYVFERHGGAWIQVQKVYANDAGIGDRFGDVLATDGDTLLVSASQRFEHGFDSGAVYAFVHDGAAWVQEGKLVPDDLIELDRAGAAIAIDGDTALVGAPGEQDLGIDAGSAYVFVREGGVWSQQAKLHAAEGLPGNRFGTSVALQGDNALVGAPRFDTDVHDGEGAVFAFTRSGDAWAQSARLAAPDADEDTGFGTSLAVDGATAVVGAPRAGGSYYGGAYVFVRPADEWIWQATLMSDDNDSRIGGSVVIDDGRVLVGRSTTSNVGAAYLFEKVGGIWRERARLDAVEPPNYSWFAYSIGLSNGTVVLTASRSDDLGNESGSAYVFEPVPSVPRTAAFRNGGTNPASFVAMPANVGQDLFFVVQPQVTGHEQALVVGYDSAFEMTLGGGQTLLVLDQLGYGKLLDTGFHPGPNVGIQLPVPDVPELVGFTLHTQAIHAFGKVPFALSNAQDVVIGGCAR